MAALPRILQTLKARGYRIVHVVPATQNLMATPTEPQQWFINPTTETVATSHWPKIPNFVYAATDTLPAPEWFDFDWRDVELGMLTRRMRGVPLALRTKWPQPIVVSEDSVPSVLSTPVASVFKLDEAEGVTMLGTLRRAEQTAQAALEPEVAAKPDPAPAGKSRGARGAMTRHAHGGPAAVRPAARQGRHVAAHAAPKQAQGKRKPGSVRVAGLKKR